MTPEAMATNVLSLLRAGRFAQVRDMFAENVRTLVTPEALEAAWAGAVARYGDVTGAGTPIAEPVGRGATVVKIPVICDHGELALVVTVGGHGALGGLQLAPADVARPAQPWEPPGYADPGTFDEREVTVGDGPLAVPGTVTEPTKAGPGPAVVLLAGSGPLDRDSTIGRRKPFKDLAWGLASRGIVVLRFDKVTYAHADRLGDLGAFTVGDEYLHHAVAAVRLLREHPAVDPARVFVLGHSLGGTVAPRVAVREPAVAGLVLLAGGAQPMHRAAVRQFRYLASGPGSESLIDAVTRQADAVDSPDLSPSTPASELPFGVPAAYWLDLRGYDAPALAATVDRPVLVLQGGRDYQSTVDDDLSRWRAALDHRPAVTIRVYDADDHCFVPGTGPSRPSDYERPGHVDPDVVSDIATWLNGAPVEERRPNSR